MVSKKLPSSYMSANRVWLGLLCIVVLVGAVGGTLIGIFIGNRISSLESQVDSLQDTVSSLEDEVDRLLDELADMNSTRTFIFEWLSWEQNIVNGTLRMELTFAWKGENLSIIAKINDDEYGEQYEPDYNATMAEDLLVLVLDLNNDGQLVGESALMAYADNYTRGGVLCSNGQIATPLWEKQPSRFHTCVFEPDVGYTFNVVFPLVLLPELQHLSSDLVYVCFVDTGGSVDISFHWKT